MIYVDNAATARMPRAVIDAVLPYLGTFYGNPSSPNKAGVSAACAVKGARKRIAELLGANENEIIFTSGGSEANNQAILTAKNHGLKNGKKRIITTAIEHDSVFNAVKHLENDGFTVMTVGVNGKGFVSAEEIKTLINDDVCLVSVMTANNEIGTLQPISEIGAFCREKGVLFHTDAVQAAGHVDIDFKKLKVDMLSVSAHKFGGMKGVGALCVRNGIIPESLVIGGKQEQNRRAGTENVAGIVSMAKALELSLENLSEKQKSLAAMRNKLAEKLLDIPETVLNGSLDNRLAGNLNVSFKGVDSEPLLLLLDEADICASAGAACHTGLPEPSRVLTALGRESDYALGTIRFSLSNDNTESEIDYIAETVTKAIEKLR